jgi:hypothetical protein
MTSTDDTRVQLTTTAAGVPAIPAQRGPTAEGEPVPSSEEERATAPGGRPRHVAQETARPVLEPAAHDIARPGPRPVDGSRAGWILLTTAAAAAAWGAGWVAGVSWAWRAMTPRYLRWTHQRQGAALARAGSPVRS